MAHDVQELDQAVLFIHGVQQEIVLIQMQFADAFHTPLQDVVPPSFAEDEKRPLIMRREEINDFSQSRDKMCLTAPSDFEKDLAEMT